MPVLQSVAGMVGIGHSKIFSSQASVPSLRVRFSCVSDLWEGRALREAR